MRALDRPCLRRESYARKEADHDSLDDCGVRLDLDRSVTRVLRHERHVSPAPPEPLERCLAIEGYHDDFAVIGCRLMAHDHAVAVKDPGVLHAVTGNKQREVSGATDPLGRDRDPGLDVLVGGDGDAGYDSSDEWNASHRRGLLCETYLAVSPPTRELEVAFALEHSKVVARRASGSPPELGTKVPIGRSRFSLVQASLNGGEDLGLDAGQPVVHTDMLPLK